MSGTSQSILQKGIPFLKRRQNPQCAQDADLIATWWPEGQGSGERPTDLSGWTLLNLADASLYFNSWTL